MIRLRSCVVIHSDGVLNISLILQLCWISGTFPLCDGSHVKHNKATGDNVYKGERSLTMECWLLAAFDGSSVPPPPRNMYSNMKAKDEANKASGKSERISITREKGKQKSSLKKTTR
ncbi:hypothetical protein Tco_0881932 [Tanacetum coccineum]